MKALLLQQIKVENVGFSKEVFYKISKEIAKNMNALDHPLEKPRLTLLL